MKLQCAHSDVERVLLKLHTEIFGYNDAYIHQSVIINENNLDLHVTADMPSSPEEVLFKVPGRCLVIVDKFRFTIEDDALCLHETDSDVMENQKRICELMIELYNLTSKVKEYKKTSHYFAFARYPKLIQYLNQGRPERDNLLWKQGKMGKLLLQELLGRRVMCMPGKGSAGPVRALHPFIDCLNHHNKAPRYQVTTNGNENTEGQILWTFNTQSMFGVDECVVCYTLLDPLDSLLNYGFVETSGTICKSVPLEIILSNGLVINIKSEFRLFQGELPPDLKDLFLFYVPQIWKANQNQNRVFLSHVFIPGIDQPEALRRVLAFLVEITCPGLPKTLLTDLVLEAEAAIISENLSYYIKLLDFCRKIEGKINQSESIFFDMVKEMAQLQIDWIHNYRGVNQGTYCRL